MDRIVKTETMIENEETIISHFTIKNEPGTSVEHGTDDATVKPEHGHNIITSFFYPTRGFTVKTEHPLINQDLVRGKDQMPVKRKCEQDEQDDRLDMFSNISSGEDTSSVRDSGRYTRRNDQSRV